MVCSAFAALFCKVDLLSSSVSFSPLPTLLQQKGVKAKDIKEWKHSVQQAFAQVLSRLKTLRLQPPLPAWEEFEAQIREVVVNKAVEVIPDKAEGALSVIGFVDDVTRLEPTINELLNRIEKIVVRENASIIQGLEISQEDFQLLCEDGLPDLLKIQYPQLEITYKDKLILKGLSHEISDAASLIMTGVQKILDGHAEPALCSTSAVLENVPQDMSKDFMEMLVKNICKNFQSSMNTQNEFSLEILSDLCSAVVTFSSGKGSHVILK